jgi:lysophospholipase L1-like esterase
LSHPPLGSPIRRTAALAVVSSFVALGLAEGVTRSLGLAPAVGRIVVDDADSPLQPSEDALQGYELKPGFRSVAHPGFRTNRNGLRGAELATPKPAGVFRIALVGDSVVEGVGLEREEDTLPVQLERLLADRRIEVINAATRGYNTQAEVELFRRRVLPYEPDLVIVVFVRNDHQRLNRHAGASWSYRRPRSTERLFHASHLFRLVALRLNLFHFREEVDPDYLDERIGRAQAEDNVAVGLAELAGLSGIHRFRAIVAVWPNFSDSINDPPGLMEAQSDRMRVETLAARHWIPVVRLSEAFARDYARRGPGRPSPHQLYALDGMHPTAVGARVAAAALRQLLDEYRLLVPHRRLEQVATGTTSLDGAGHQGENQ